jgi:hypothetical protein
MIFPAAIGNSLISVLEALRNSLINEIEAFGKSAEIRMCFHRSSVENIFFLISLQ